MSIGNISWHIKEIAWKTIQNAQVYLLKYRIPPSILNPLLRLFEDDHRWKTEWVKTEQGFSFFECTCTSCGLIRKTHVLGDPFPRYCEIILTRPGATPFKKPIEFERCIDRKFKTLLK